MNRTTVDISYMCPEAQVRLREPDEPIPPTGLSETGRHGSTTRP